MNRILICDQADEAIFLRQCSALEQNIPGIEKVKLLHDVDGSKTQIYRVSESRVLVHNSYYMDEVYIETEVDLKQYFE